MSNTLSIDLIAQNGACRPHCNLLREIYPDGVIVFAADLYPQVREKKVNVLWGSSLLSREVQLGLALSWYDRALAAVEPSWKASLRSLIETPDFNAASTQLGLRLTERREADSADLVATSTAGVGYAAAALAGKFAEPTPNPERLMSAMVVMAQWCAHAAAAAESAEMETVLDELNESVWLALVEHGAVLPTF